MKTVRVVAAILKDSVGRVLINQRPEGKPWAGYWEFPGGKIEIGETPQAALNRELHEELGVEVLDAGPWIHLSHDYPEQHVDLQVWRVRSYRGEPRARESQSLSWVAEHELSGWNLLPADAPIVTAIRLPPLMLVTPSPGPDRGKFLQILDGVLKRGADLVQLRASELGPSDYASLARAATDLCHRQRARIILNAAPELVRDVGADGVHLSNARLSSSAGRLLPQEYLVGASCHDEASIRMASRHGLDYIVLGPVQATPSHPSAPPLGWDGFKRLTSCSTLPVYAVGGMLPEYLERVRSLGGHGIAAIRGLWEAQ
jgi:8-oxo-dGTP diphosphatase